MDDDAAKNKLVVTILVLLVLLILLKMWEITRTEAPQATRPGGHHYIACPFFMLTIRDAGAENSASDHLPHCPLPNPLLKVDS